MVANILDTEELTWRLTALRKKNTTRQRYGSWSGHPYSLYVFIMTEAQARTQKSRPTSFWEKCPFNEWPFTPTITTLTISTWFLIKHFIVYPWKVSLAYIIGCKPSEILQKSHINCWLEECEQTLTAGQTEAQHLIENLSYSVCMSSCCREKWEAKEKKTKNIWHERLLVNNLQGHTEHVRPTKTIQLQAPRLPFSARARSNPRFVLIGRCYRHQGENGSQDTHRASLKKNKAVREVCSLGRERMER